MKMIWGDLGLASILLHWLLNILHRLDILVSSAVSHYVFNSTPTHSPLLELQFVRVYFWLKRKTKVNMNSVWSDQILGKRLILWISKIASFKFNNIYENSHVSLFSGRKVKSTKSSGIKIAAEGELRTWKCTVRNFVTKILGCWGIGLKKHWETKNGMTSHFNSYDYKVQINEVSIYRSQDCLW